MTLRFGDFVLDSDARQRLLNVFRRGEPRAHRRELPIHRGRCRLWRRVALDLVEHERAIDQLRQNLSDRIGRLFGRHQAELPRGGDVAHHDQLAGRDREHPVDDLGAG